MSGPIAGARVERQAVFALRGYGYQLWASTLAWVELPDNATLYLEVAEDYAVVAKRALEAVQVKDTAQSRTITLNSESVRDAIAHYVELRQNNPSSDVRFRFLTTSEIGTERNPRILSDGQQGLRYWKSCAAGAEVGPLRELLESTRFPVAVREFCKSRIDSVLRRDLFQKVDWDCGLEGSSALREELESQLVRICREHFHVSSAAVPWLADVLFAAVLRRATDADPSSRTLTQADLYRTIDGATQRSVSQSYLSKLEGIVQGLAHKGISLVDAVDVPESQLGWLIDVRTLPPAAGTIPRKAVETAVATATERHGICVLHGSTGVGKSTIARSAVACRDSVSFLASFRDLDARATCGQLEMLLSRIRALDANRLILEDVNTLHDTRVSGSMSRVIEALRRNGCTAVLTCYEPPSKSTLAGLSLEASSAVPCPYFSRKETGLLVKSYGGDPNTWGPIAYSLGGSGHPQLVHAFVRGACDRGWPEAETEDPLTLRTSVADIDAVRREARRRLVEALPSGTRALLYRLSVSTVHFNREAAVAIGKVPGEIANVGECLDALIGPWVESVGTDLFRVSPLAGGFSDEMMTRSERRCVHEVLAVEAMQNRRLILSDTNGILMHAMEGQSENSLVLLAWSVLSTKGTRLVALAEHFVALRACSTGERIYERSLRASVLLRMAQARLCMASKDRRSLTDVVAALLRETEAVEEPQLRDSLKAHSLANLLATSGVANDLSIWVDLLSDAKRAVGENAILTSFAAQVEEELQLGEGEFVRALFWIGSTNIASVARLETIVEELDALEPAERAIWLKPMDGASSDYSPLVGLAWVNEDAANQLNPADAARRYGRMAERTRRWGVPGLSAQCSATQAVLLDQHQGLRKEALAVLDDAEECTEGHWIVRRAKAGLYYNHGEYGKALELFPAVLVELTSGNPVERALVLREAAISAGYCERWRDARDWFVESQKAARSVETNDMRVMAIALEVDVAGAALMLGNVRDAIRGFGKSLEEVDRGEMPETLRAAYCQRMVRHAVMWCKGRVSGKGFKGADGQPLVFQPGMASNLAPMPEIRDQPLVPSDTAWYMLAQAEVEGGVDAGIGRTLERHLSGGPIPILEAGLRSYKMNAHIDRLDAESVAIDMMSYLEGAVFLLQNRERAESLDPMHPERGSIPTLSDETLQDPLVKSGAMRCVLAFGIRALCADQVGAIDELNQAWRERFGAQPAGGIVSGMLTARQAAGDGLEGAIVEAIQAFHGGRRPGLEAFWGTGFCLAKWIDESEFGQSLMKALAGWQRREWSRLVEEELSSLVVPQVAVQEVQRVLRMPDDSRTFVLRLLNATMEAADVTGRNRYRTKIDQMLAE